MAWDVVSQEEQADGYRVQLSYQLAHGFRGEPGVEEFTIDRQGSVQSRRIVSEPARIGGFLGCGLMAVWGLLSMVLVAGGVLATAL